MTRRVLRVVPRPDPGAGVVLEIAEGGLRGDGTVDLHCGLCDAVLAAGLPDERLDKLRAAVVARYLEKGGARTSAGARDLVLRCPDCGAHNLVAPGP